MSCLDKGTWSLSFGRPGPLSHLGLGRIAQGDNAKAKAAYQDFLAL
jgi:hypothetical protein